MLHYFLLGLMAASYVYSVYSNRRILTMLHDIRFAQRETGKNLDERITSLRDHVRSTEKALFKAIDEISNHSTDHSLKPQISALEEEIKKVNAILEKYIVLEIPKQKTKKAKS